MRRGGGILSSLARFGGGGAISLGPLSLQVFSITVGSLAAMGIPATVLFAVGARSWVARSVVRGDGPHVCRRSGLHGCPRCDHRRGDGHGRGTARLATPHPRARARWCDWSSPSCLRWPDRGCSGCSRVRGSLASPPSAVVSSPSSTSSIELGCGTSLWPAYCVTLSVRGSDTSGASTAWTKPSSTR